MTAAIIAVAVSANRAHLAGRFLTTSREGASTVCPPRTARPPAVPSPVASAAWRQATSRRCVRASDRCQSGRHHPGRCGDLFLLGLFGSEPLQLFVFGELPLQFTYLDSSHYNSSSTGNKPLDMYLKALGPCAAYASLYLHKCHSLPLSLTPWTHLIASSSPIPSPPPHSPAPATIGLPHPWACAVQPKLSIGQPLLASRHPPIAAQPPSLSTSLYCHGRSRWSSATKTKRGYENRWRRTCSSLTWTTCPCWSKKPTGPSLTAGRWGHWRASPPG